MFGEVKEYTCGMLCVCNEYSKVVGNKIGEIEFGILTPISESSTLGTPKKQQAAFAECSICLTSTHMLSNGVYKACRKV